MNNIPRLIKFGLAFVAACGIFASFGLCLTGCVSKNPAPATVTQVPGLIVTNPPVAPSTNPIIIQLPSITVTNPPTPAYVPDPRINEYSNYAQQAVGVAAAVVPGAAPYTTLASTGIGLIGALIGVISGYVAQKKSTNAALAQASQNSDMLTAVIQGVESATSKSTITADSVKSAIQDTATAAGVQSQLHKVVQANT